MRITTPTFLIIVEEKYYGILTIRLEKVAAVKIPQTTHWTLFWWKSDALMHFGAPMCRSGKMPAE